MNKQEHTPKEAVLILLDYLHTKGLWSTHVDDFSAHMCGHGIDWDKTEFLLYLMEDEGLIVYIR